MEIKFKHSCQCVKKIPSFIIVVMELVHYNMCNQSGLDFLCENKHAVMAPPPRQIKKGAELQTQCTLMFVCPGYRPVLILQAGQGALELLLVLVLQVGQQHVLSAG